MSETNMSSEKTVELAFLSNEGESAAYGSSQDLDLSPGTKGVGRTVSETERPPAESTPSAASPLNGKEAQSETTSNEAFLQLLQVLTRELLGITPNSTSDYTEEIKSLRKKLFGLGKGLSSENSAGTESNNRFNYEQKYPRDRPGEETADNARVWLTYLDEAEAFDRERVDGWKETADVLLVFAGLFSGVITTFVSQASQSLQQDNTQVSASLLFEIAQILRAQSSGTPINIIPNSTLTPTSPFTPSTNAFLVNGLWFTSLAIALSTALFAVLAKQWLYYYLTSITGTAHEKARARHLRFKGFELWKVGVIVDLLPILLHLAVGIFLMGIVILLFPLDVRIAWAIVVIAGTTYFLYFVSVVLPIRYPECPYTTSLTIYIGVLVFSLRTTLHWISRILENGFRAIWRGINSDTRHTIRRLLHYTQGLFRHAFHLVWKLVGFVRCGFQKLRDTIFTDEFRRMIFTEETCELLDMIFIEHSESRDTTLTEELPKFTKWREENIKKAVKDAGFLDFEALDWLYATSPNRSVHRIIARCVAVHPDFTQKLKFNFDILNNLWRTLEVSETNIVDLRYGLCLDLLPMVGWSQVNWCLLQSIPDMDGSQLEEAEYRSYSRIAENVIDHNYHQIIEDAINDDLKFPLVMWQLFFTSASVNVTVVAHILTSGHRGLFEWKSTRNTGVISFNDNELGWWKFACIFRYFFRNREPDYSSNKTFEIRYLLLITIYRNLTSDRPVIVDKEQRQKSLSNLFHNFGIWLFSPNQHISLTPKQYFTFFIDICSADALFWSEFMTDRARVLAVQCLNKIWKSMDTDVANRFPFTDCYDLTLLYRWCSRDFDPESDFSGYTSPICAQLLMPQNRDSLCTILSNDSDAVSNFSTCLRNYRNCASNPTVHRNLIDFLTSVDANGSLFTVLYNSSVLVQLWKYLSFRESNQKKKFLSILKSKLDPQKLHDLYCIMNEEALSEENTDHCRSALEAFAREFGQSMGVASQLQSSVENQSTEEKNHDSEERALQPEEPNENEHENSNSIIHRTKKIFQSVWQKIDILAVK